MRIKNTRALKLPFIPVAVFLALIELARPGEWWEDKLPSQWTPDQVVDFLNNSPWVGKSNGYFQQAPWVSRSDGRIKQAPLEMIRFQARILTAKPVRDAFLRLNVLDAPVVTARDLHPKTAGEESEKRLRELLASYPDDLLVKGDEKNLIIAVSQKIHTMGIYGVESSQEVFRNDELSRVDKSALVATTRLETSTGKRVALDRYRPPGTKRPGAMYYFPRNLPDGTPFVTAADRELRFETVIDKRKVKIAFDLRKMRHKGKLEI